MRVNGTEMYLRRFKIYAPATMPASAMSKVDYFRVARDPSRIDATRGDHFLQADFPALISSMSGLAIYHSSRRS